MSKTTPKADTTTATPDTAQAQGAAGAVQAQEQGANGDVQDIEHEDVSGESESGNTDVATIPAQNNTGMATAEQLQTPAAIIGAMRQAVNLENPALYDAMANADPASYVDVSGEYFKFDRNHKGRRYFVMLCGITTIPNKYKKNENDPETKEAVQFKMKDETGVVKTYATSDSVLLGEGLRINEAGTFPVAFQVENLGEIQGKAGTYTGLRLSRMVS